MATQKPVSGTVKIPVKASEIASIRVVDTDLVVILKTGQRLNIRDGAMRAMLDPDLRITFLDGELCASDMLKQVGDVQLGSLSGATVGDAAAANVPPSGKAGEALTVTIKEPESLSVDSSAASVAATAPLIEEIKALKQSVELMSERVVSMEERVAAIPAPPPEKTGFLANISPLWGALGLAGAAGGGGGGGSAAASAVKGGSGSSYTSLVTGGFITLGPVVAENGLRVTAYDRTGRILGVDWSVDPETGKYEIAIAGGYDDIIIFKVTDADGGEDYVDERTQLAASLGEGTLLHAVVVAGGTGSQKININLVTQVAAEKLSLLTVDGVPKIDASLVKAKVTETNSAVAKAFGLSDTEGITTIDAVATVDIAGNKVTGNKLGGILEEISLAGKNQSINEVTSRLANQVTIDSEGNGTLSGGKDQTTIFKTISLVPQTVKSGSLKLSSDTGNTFGGTTDAGLTDFVTKNASQTITATLDRALEGTDKLYGSVDNGVTWVNLANYVSGTDIVWEGATLSGSSSIVFKVSIDGANDKLSGTQAYVLDVSAPSSNVEEVTLTKDTGTSNTDRLTKTA